MVMMTASEASRQFSAVLDRTAHGERIVITRGGRRVAMLSPIPAGNGGDLLALVEDWRPTEDDPTFPDHLAQARAAVTADEDPWSGG